MLLKNHVSTAPLFILGNHKLTTSASFKEKLIEKFTAESTLGHYLMTPLIVSQTYKTLYFHIAKTGGSSIAQLLRENGLDDGVLSNKKESLEIKTVYFKEVVENWDEYYKFTFVRNKFDLLISLYNYDRQLNGKFSLSKDVTFEQFIKEYVGCDDTDLKQGLYTDWIDQHYLTHLNGEHMYDFIGQFDNFDDDLNKVCYRLGLHKTRGSTSFAVGLTNTQIRVNVGNYDRSKKEGYYTPDLKEVVRARFPEEMQTFGW